MSTRITLILLFFSGTALAQNHLAASLEKGVEAHRRYSLIACDTILDRVLDRKADLSDQQYGEAFYFYTRNLMRMAVEMGNEENGFATIDVQLKLYRVYNNFLQLEKANIPRWSPKAGPEIQNLVQTLLKASVTCLEVYVQDPSRQKEMKTLIEGYTNLAASIMPDGYAPVELKGQLYYLEGDTTRAMKFFNEAIDKYNEKRLLMADNIRIPNVYYTLALRAVDNSLINAHKLAKHGYQINELEWNTIKANAKKLGENVIEDNKNIYFNNQYNLGLLELETAMAAMPKDSVIWLYEQRIEYYHELYSVQFNYAEMLREVNPRKASMHYQNAIEIDPSNPEAYFAMATLYFDLGYYYLKESKDNKANSKENEERALQLLGVGVGNMEKVLELNPNDKTALKWLVKVYRDVGQKSKSKEYQLKLDGL